MIVSWWWYTAELNVAAPASPNDSVGPIDSHIIVERLSLHASVRDFGPFTRRITKVRVDATIVQVR